tara:strand:- start:676 stop:999 length:324 start_codon:yes stop_codon:yes gene_type:complete
MEAQPIMVAGKKRPVKFGFAALRAFGDETNTSLNDLSAISEDITMTQAIGLCWAGLKDGARSVGEEFNLSLDDVGDLLDEDPDALSSIMNVFADMQAQPKKSNPKKK